MIVLQESLRAVFYAPFYAALALDAYGEEGVEVRFATAPSPGAAARGLFDGSVDVTWGGPMRVIQTYAMEPACDIVCFGEVVTRDPFFLMGAKPNPTFTMRDLVGRRLGSVAEVPTPWLCLQQDVRDAGIDPGSLDRTPDRSMAQNVAALESGELDVVQVFQPYVEALVESGAGHIWYAAANRGPTSYTTLYARRPVVETRREDLSRMVRALHRTLKWVHSADAARIAEAIGIYFPELPKSRLAAAIARYKDLQVWGRNPRLPRRGYDRLAHSLLSGGFVKSAPSFEHAVDNSFAERSIADDPPPLSPD